MVEDTREAPFERYSPVDLTDEDREYLPEFEIFSE